MIAGCLPGIYGKIRVAVQDGKKEKEELKSSSWIAQAWMEAQNKQDKKVVGKPALLHTPWNHIVFNLVLYWGRSVHYGSPNRALPLATSVSQGAFKMLYSTKSNAKRLKDFRERRTIPPWLKG